MRASPYSDGSTLPSSLHHLYRGLAMGNGNASLQQLMDVLGEDTMLSPPSEDISTNTEALPNWMPDETSERWPALFSRRPTRSPRFARALFTPRQETPLPQPWPVNAPSVTDRTGANTPPTPMAQTVTTTPSLNNTPDTHLSTRNLLSATNSPRSSLARPVVNLPTSDASSSNATDPPRLPMQVPHGDANPLAIATAAVVSRHPLVMAHRQSSGTLNQRLTIPNPTLQSLAQRVALLADVQRIASARARVQSSATALPDVRSDVHLYRSRTQPDPTRASSTPLTLRPVQPSFLHQALAAASASSSQTLGDSADLPRRSRRPPTTTRSRTPDARISHLGNALALAMAQAARRTDNRLALNPSVRSALEVALGRTQDTEPSAEGEGEAAVGDAHGTQEEMATHPPETPPGDVPMHDA
jgi:hypothetical protein